MKRKLLPPFIMLTAGLITSIRTFCLHYDMKSSLIILLVVLVVFYVLGSIFKYILDLFEKENEQKALDEGDTAALQSTITSVLQTEEGARLLSQLEQMFK